MPSLPGPGPYTHLDEDTDSVFQARNELVNALLRINYIIDYLSSLFGWDGTKGTAIATLFSNQAVLFPAGTRMYFFQASAPPGWVQLPFDTGRYLMAVPDGSGGGWLGDFNTVIQSTSTILTQAHLPSVNFTGYADWSGTHYHENIHTNINYNTGSVSFERDANGPRAYALYETVGTSSNGLHTHDVSIWSGGAGAGHTHSTSMTPYRPPALTGIIGYKA